MHIDFLNSGSINPDKKNHAFVEESCLVMADPFDDPTVFSFHPREKIDRINYSIDEEETELHGMAKCKKENKAMHAHHINVGPAHGIPQRIFFLVFAPLFQHPCQTTGTYR